MKRFISALIVLIAVLGTATACFAEAPSEERKVQYIAGVNPVLKSISFKNAKIIGEFSPYTNEYKITLDNPTVSPTLQSYEIAGEAKMFINYTLDYANHQTGITATLEYENGSTIYNFNYINAESYSVNSNNYLLDLSCHATEVYPRINRQLTDYELYIPRDMTELHLTAVTQDVSAYCNVPSEIFVGADQEPLISVNVTASDGTVRTYNFQVKRIKKSTAEVERIIKRDDFVTLAENKLFYKTPVFIVITTATAVGIVFIAALIAVAKRIAVKAEDEDEEEFFK